MLSRKGVNGHQSARPDHPGKPRLPYLTDTYRALTAAKNGPSIYDLCDPLLLGPGGGDAHLRKFYKTAIANPLLRPLLSRAGLPALRDEAQFNALREAIVAARDQASPDWLAIGQPVAALLDQAPQTHPRRKPAPSAPEGASFPEIDQIIRSCALHLLGSFEKNEFIPAYAAFNLIGDPDFRGRELLIALQGLHARTYKNSTLLFNLARAFIAGSPAGAVINPAWHGLAERLWAPVQIRHRSAYYDAFYAEALMDFLASGLATPQQINTTRGTIERLVGFCLRESRERVPSLIDRAAFDVVTALAPAPHGRDSAASSPTSRPILASNSTFRTATPRPARSRRRRSLDRRRSPRTAPDRLLRRLPDRPGRQH